MPSVLVFNAGSSTLKLAVYALGSGEPVRVSKGLIDLRHTPLSLELEDAAGARVFPIDAPVEDDLHSVIQALVAQLDALYPAGDFVAVGHRIVHGGASFNAPVWLDDTVIAALDELAPLAPLHQPGGLRLARAMAKVRPQLRQLACFDTAFHHTQLPHATRMAIPRALHDEGVRRYGFHGLSYQSIAEDLKAHDRPLAANKWIVAHLGSGASLCALAIGESRDTSMGFSALDGIPMATRPGSLDAGVPLYLQQQRGMSVDALQQWLYHDCGLLGVSGISADARVLDESDAPEAVETMDYFAFRIAREICALASSLGGIEGLVFTAGIGEHQPRLRANVVQRLAWLGASLDADANQANARVIQAPDSRIALRVIATREEQMIANALSTALEH